MTRAMADVYLMDDFRKRKFERIERVAQLELDTVGQLNNMFPHSPTILPSELRQELEDMKVGIREILDDHDSTRYTVSSGNDPDSGWTIFVALSIVGYAAGSNYLKEEISEFCMMRSRGFQRSGIPLFISFI